MPLQSSPFQNDQPQLSTSNQNVEYFQNNNNNHHPQQSNSFTTPRETGKNFKIIFFVYFEIFLFNSKVL